jgi:hypothetical protein
MHLGNHYCFNSAPPEEPILLSHNGYIFVKKLQKKRKDLLLRLGGVHSPSRLLRSNYETDENQC